MSIFKQMLILATFKEKYESFDVSLKDCCACVRVRRSTYQTLKVKSTRFILKLEMYTNYLYKRDEYVLSYGL